MIGGMGVPPLASCAACPGSGSGGRGSVCPAGRGGADRIGAGQASSGMAAIAARMLAFAGTVTENRALARRIAPITAAL